MADWATEVAADTPFAWWKNDEASGATAFDEMAGSHDGTHVNTPAVIVGGDGLARTYVAASSKYTNVGTLGSFGSSISSNGFTMEVWARWTDTAVRGLLGLSEGSNTLFRLSVNKNNTGSNNTGGRIHGEFRGDTGGYSSRASTAQTMADGNWHHLVCTRAASGVSGTPNIYVDGALSNGASTSGTPTALANFVNPLLFGGANVTGTPGLFFEGDIDDVVLYDKVLSAARISAHFAATRTPGSLGGGGTGRSHVVIIG